MLTRTLVSGFAGALGILLTSTALAGGGGENMLLVVNAYDENAIRIATAYQQIRNIPTQNILFINPNTYYGMQPIDLTNDTTAMNTYLTPIANAISSRGLSSQIDYIGTIGMPTTAYTTKYSGGSSNQPYSLNYRLMRLDKETGGSSSISLSTYQYQTDLGINTNKTLDHSQSYYGESYYMSGAIGFTGSFGNTATQVINNLYYTASGDGTKPQGTIYFEENDNIRSDVREYQWPDVQAALTARGINWIQERNTSGSTPQNRTDVKGAIIGSFDYAASNGSTYLPGSWADSLTSYGAYFTSSSQTKATASIAAGAAASCGTVVEPYAITSKFTNANIHVFLADGSTIGESFYKSVASPYHQMLLGDMLAQPNADLPTIHINSAPGNGQNISGTVGISATASLTNPTIATDIKEMRLLVDGKVIQTNTGASANFNLDTLGLTDGQHELRIVAINNAAAESQNTKVWNVSVNNKGQSVTATSGNMIAQDKQVLSVSVAANAGTGASVSRIELRSLGRVMGQVNSVNGSINLDASKLAYGDNPIIPVAILSDGSEVAGNSINVTRHPTYIQGIQNYTGPKTAGVKVEYFAGQGGTTIASSNFSGTATKTLQYDRSILGNSSKTRLVDNYMTNSVNTIAEFHPSDLSIDKLAVRMTGHFEVAASSAGEYAFYLYSTNDSAKLSIDGQKIVNYDGANWAPSFMFLPMCRLFLGQGIHDFELLTSNTLDPSDQNDLNYYDICLLYQGTDGVWRYFDSTNAFTIPEPASITLLAIASVALLSRQRS